MCLFRYKDTMRTVEMQYGQNTTRWQSSLNTRWLVSEGDEGDEVVRSEAGGGAEDSGLREDVVVGLPAERIPPGQVNMWMK